MKQRSLSILALLLFTSLASAQLKSPLKITVDKDQKTKQEIKQQGRATQSGITTHISPQVTEQNRQVTMNIKLQNLGASPMTGLTVKYTLFARDKETRSIRPVGNGEKQLDIKQLESKTIRTEPVAFESQDVNYSQGYGSELNRSRGKEYYGIAVTVLIGEDRVAAYFNPPSLEKVVEKQGEESK